MDFFAAIGAMDVIRLSGTSAANWYVEEAREAMERGDILYAGKYSAPDYERIVSENCDLAVESTMIYHKPEVKEKLEEFGIPVLVERSSYEPHPLGRAEWIRLYGALTDREEEADSIFEEQNRRVEDILSEESADTGCTVAFFSVNMNGSVTVRRPGDYISKIIDLAGGDYIFGTAEEEDSALSTMKMQMEEFYAGAVDADYMIYNSTIAGEVENLDALLDKNPLFADFRAVKEGNAWCITQDLFQKSAGLADIIVDIHTMLTQGKNAPDQLTFMYRLK